MKPQPLNIYEYEVLTHTWKGARGAAYNAALEFCVEMGYAVYKLDGPFVVTPAGRQAIQAFQAEENFRRIDVI